MNPNDDRRIADEQFRRELAERLKALEKSHEFLIDELKDQKTSFFKTNESLLTLHYTLFGGPEPDKAGLLEKFRKVATRDKWIIWAGAVALGLLGKIASPLYDKIVSEWVYNSVSEKWMKEHSQPKVTHKHYVIKNTPDPAE